MMNLAMMMRGVNKPEMLDPMAILLIESLAEEIYHLAFEIDNLESRVLNKLSSILVSETGTLARPAHSLLHISPREYKLDLTNVDSFVLDEQKKEEDKLFLYPVCNTSLYQGGVRYFMFDKYLFRMDRELTKTLVNRSGTIPKETDATNSFWFGLELDHRITDIENLSFYINLSHGYHSTDSLKQLLHSQWRCAGENITVCKGLYAIEENFENPILNLFRTSDHTYKINHEIKEGYDKHFITINQSLDITGRKEIFPATLKSCFPESVYSDFTKELLWFEITCPSSFTEEIIRSVEISINVIPVVCKRLVNKVIQVNKCVPVIPLVTGENESFLSVYSLYDSDSICYYDIPLSDRGEEKYGIYCLRNGGCERFDESDAQEFLANITYRLSQEAASFFKQSSESKSEKTTLQDNMAGMIRGLSKAVHSEVNSTEVKNYLLVEQQRETEIYFLKYWTANTLIGESIKEHTPVRPISDMPVNSADVHLMRPLTSEKRTPRLYEKDYLNKRSLDEHPLLVSANDIKDFCLKEFAQLIEGVEVCPGYKKSDGAGTDFIKTTDVYLRVRPLSKDIVDHNIPRYVEQVLQEHSPATFTYRVIVR